MTKPRRGGKRVAGNPTSSDLVQDAPRAKLASISKVDGSRREIRVGERVIPNKEQLDAVSDIKKTNEELVNVEHPHDFTMKSNYGEMKTDIDLERNGGYQRVSNFRVTPIKDKGHHGILLFSYYSIKIRRLLFFVGDFRYILRFN